jgi:hypothetical protein
MKTSQFDRRARRPVVDPSEIRLYWVAGARESRSGLIPGLAGLEPVQALPKS